MQLKNNNKIKKFSEDFTSSPSCFNFKTETERKCVNLLALEAPLCNKFTSISRSLFLFSQTNTDASLHNKGKKQEPLRNILRHDSLRETSSI